MPNAVQAGGGVGEVGAKGGGRRWLKSRRSFVFPPSFFLLLFFNSNNKQTHQWLNDFMLPQKLSLDVSIHPSHGGGASKSGPILQTQLDTLLVMSWG